MTTVPSLPRGRRAALVSVCVVLMLSACSRSADPNASAAQSPPQSAAGRIAFGQFNDAIGDFLLFTADPDGSDIQPLLPGAAECPDWAPDGSATLVVCVADPRGLLRPATVRSDGSALTILDNPDKTLNIACGAGTPDGSRLLCEAWDDAHPARSGIYTVRSSDGGDLQLLLAEPTGGQDIPGNYSPDGGQIVYTRADPNDAQSCAAFVMDAGGSHGHRITPYGATSCGYVSWSPAGDEIVLANGGLAVVHPDGTGLRQIALTGLNGASAFAPTWSPDGTRILVSISVRPDRGDLYTIGLDGSDLTQVTNTPGVEEDLASWGNVVSSEPSKT